MIVRLLLAVIILGYLFWLYYKYQQLPANKKRGWLFKITIYNLAGIMLFAVLTGKMHWIGALLAGAIAAGRYSLRFLPVLNFFKAQNLFGNPVFKTRYLHVQLDLNAGTLSGNIVDGPHAGMPLEQLTPEILKELEDYYQDRDSRSYYLIRVLQQRANAQANSGANTHNTQTYNNQGDPAYEEALQILGLETLAKEKTLSKHDIIKAHRQLIQKLHPDRGGNDYLAARVNQAKEVLLKSL